jgi:predicted DNA-binding transcriptional regulator AlpA
MTSSLPEDLKKIRWLTENEVSLITGRALSTLRNERSQGRGLRYAKIGRSVRYRLSDVMAFMESHLVHREG